MSEPKFGTAGAGELFYSRGGKHSHEIPAFLATLGLTAFEYQCGRGVRIKANKAALLGESAAQYQVALSIHAPYYISLASEDEEKRRGNLRYFLESVQAAKAMGAKRVVFHPGGIGKRPRKDMFALAQSTLADITPQLDEQGYGDIILCPETMGKINQLGDLEETIAFCRSDDRMIPCVDFGHMNARLQGAVDGIEAYRRIFEQIADGLGVERARNLHCHFSKIEYSTGGEKKHLTFEDTVFGPDYQPLLEVIDQQNYTPVIICESAGTQAEDAQTMAQAYAKISVENAEIFAHRD